MHQYAKPFVPFFDNVIDAFIPELWARETLAILNENMVMAMLVHRDFEDEIAQWGDVVNTRKPGKFNATRKGVNDDVTTQDATAQNVAVPLDQHLHTSFIIRDGEEAKAFTSLVSDYLEPAVTSIAQKVDRIISAQVHQYVDQFAGRLQKVDATTIKSFVLEAREKLNKQLAHTQDRNLVVTPGTETAMLGLDEFTRVDASGGADALRNGMIGRLYGFNIFMAQQTPEIDYRDTVTDVTKAAYLAGTTDIVVELAGASPFGIGDYVVVDGDDTPQLVTNVQDGVPAGDTTLTLHPGLKRDTASGAAVTGYKPGAVDFAAGYAVGYDKSIVTDAFDAVNGPKVGQILRFGTGAAAIDGADPIYGIVNVIPLGGGSYSIELDRPLEQAVSDNWLIAVGPSGSYNFAFHRNTLAFISRPLPQPMNGTGAQSAVINSRGLAVRVVITYDGMKQGHRVTVDILCGLEVLDKDLGVAMYG